MHRLFTCGAASDVGRGEASGRGWARSLEGAGRRSGRAADEEDGVGILNGKFAIAERDRAVRDEDLKEADSRVEALDLEEHAGDGRRVAVPLKLVVVGGDGNDDAVGVG